MAFSSACCDSSAPGVSIMLISGSCSSCASWMPRRAIRSADGPNGCLPSGGCLCRSWPINTTGREPIRASITVTAREVRPSPVPLNATVFGDSASTRCRNPGRSGFRVMVMLSQALRSTLTSVSSTRVSTSCSSFSAGNSTDTIFSTAVRSCDGEITPSITPWRARFSPVCTPSGMGVPVVSSTTRGPRKPSSAPGSANVKCPADPQEARTPPVVGLRRYTRNGRFLSLWRYTAVVMETIMANAGLPSCMRVPPEEGEISRGRPSSVAR